MATTITRIDLLPSNEVEAGEVFCGSLDSPLSQDGLRALKKVVRRRDDWDVVVTSPRSCCLQFAEWVAQKHRLPLDSNPAFREMDFGGWEGRLPADIMTEDTTILARWWSNPASLAPPQGEAFATFQQRVLGGWGHLLKEQKGKAILLVTHPGVVRLLVAQVLGMPSTRFFSLGVESASLTRIHVQHDGNNVWASLVSHGCQGW